MASVFTKGIFNQAARTMLIVGLGTSRLDWHGLAARCIERECRFGRKKSLVLKVRLELGFAIRRDSDEKSKRGIELVYVQPSQRNWYVG